MFKKEIDVDNKRGGNKYKREIRNFTVYKQI